jgi:probable HAF family extracellular repeat protein
VKNINKIAIVAVFALLFSGFTFSQAVLKAVPVPGSSPNSLIAINNGGRVVVNTATGGSSQVSTWNRISGTQVLGLSGNNNVGAAINSSGDVVGEGDPYNSGNLQAFAWQPTGSAQWLGSLGGNFSAAKGINNSMAVVGLSYTAANTQHAFLWTQGGGMQDLTPDLTSMGGGTAMAINSSNQVAGYYVPNGSSNTLGFIWTEAGGLQSLGLAGTLAYAVNDSGTVVGQSPDANGNRHAFSWTQAGGIKDLGTLGGGQSSALSVNSRGWIAGTSLTSSGTGILHGFLWTPSGGMQDFTALAGLGPSQQAYSLQVNDFGVVAISTSKGCYLLVPKMATTFTSSANPSVVGQPVTFTATMTSIAGPPPDGETVQFVVSGKVYGSAPLHSGVAQFTTSAIPVGPHIVVAKYLGDANYLPAKYTAVNQQVNP